MREEDFRIMLLGEILDSLQRAARGGSIMVSRLNAHEVEVLLGVAGIGREQHGPTILQFDHQAVVPCSMSQRLEQEHAAGNLLIAFQCFETGREHVRCAALVGAPSKAGCEAHLGVRDFLARRR